MTNDTPIVCDMTDAPDTATERFLEYQQLFRDSLIGRERVGESIRFRFRADPGVEEHVRDLAAREKSCCGFFDFTVTAVDDEVHWDATVVDDPLARQILDEFYDFPTAIAAGLPAVREQYTAAGLQVVIADGKGGRRPATDEDLGLG
jgi:hypothetical protein